MSRSDSELLERFPGVRIDQDNRDYYQGLLEHRLLLNRCRDCGAWHYPAKASCPTCWSWAVEPTEVAGDGEVYLLSFLNTRQALDAPGQPYPVAAVELREGVRFTSTLVDCPKAQMRIGMPVTLAWAEEDGMPCPAFRPAKQP